MTLEQELSRLRKQLSLEQDTFEEVGITDSQVLQINESCGALRRQIRKLEGIIYK